MDEIYCFYIQILCTMTHISPDNIFFHFSVTIVDDILNYMYRDVSNNELEANIATPNLSVVKMDPYLIEKAINKEHMNHLLLCFSRSVSNFAPNIGIIKFQNCQFVL